MDFHMSVPPSKDKDLNVLNYLAFTQSDNKELYITETLCDFCHTFNGFVLKLTLVFTLLFVPPTCENVSNRVPESRPSTSEPWDLN